MTDTLKSICLRILSHNPDYIDMYRLPQELHEQLYTWVDRRGRIALSADCVYVSCETTFSLLCNRHVTPAPNEFNYDRYDYNGDEIGDFYKLLQCKVRKYSQYSCVNFFKNTCDIICTYITPIEKWLTQSYPEIGESLVDLSASDAVAYRTQSNAPYIYGDTRPANIRFTLKKSTPIANRQRTCRGPDTWTVYIRT